MRIPAVVLEIVAGIVLGPSVLGWVHVDLPVQILALFGLAFLLFLAGLESILGAFLAGAVVSLVDRDTSSHPHFRTKLEAIGYGFVVPVFFISSGVKLDLTGLLAHPSALLRVPLFLLALLVVRGVPALLALPTNGPRATAAIGLLQATSLPFIVTATQIGMTLGKVSSVTGAALVMAGLLSVLIFPLVALGLLRGAEVDSQPWMSYGSGYSGPRPSRPTR